MDKPEFMDEDRYAAKEKIRLYRKFEKVVKRRDSSLIDKALYHFLYQYCCGYIAHYNLFGFRNEFRGFQGMIGMLEELQHHHFEWGVGKYKDIGNAFKRLAREELPRIRLEAEQEKARREREIMKALAEKHGYAPLVQSGKKDPPAYECAPDQLVSIPLATSKSSEKGKRAIHEDQLFFQLGY